MKLRIPQDSLATALANVAKAVSTKHAIPVLSGVCLLANDGTLTLRATDLELAIECTIAAAVEQPGSIVLPARYLTELVRRIPFGDLGLSVDQANYTATMTWEKSKYVMHGFPSDQFPLLPSAEGVAPISLSQAKLKEMLHQTTFAVSRDETRPYLSGVSVSLQDHNLRALSTDSVRIACSQFPISEAQGIALKAIVPGRTLHELARTLSGDESALLSLTVTDNHAFFDLDHLRMISRLLEGQFPDVLRLVPQDYHTRVTLNKSSFLDACERAALLAKDGAIKLSLRADSMVITANTPEVGQVYEELPAQLEGEPLEMGFNSRYLIEGLKVIDDVEFVFEFSGNRSPVRIRVPEGSQFIYIVLPLITY